MYLPYCSFWGHEIPCYATASPNGSITLEILRDILEHIDTIGVFTQASESLTPVLLLDGHGSRLQMPFLLYMNNLTHKWVVSIEVPNGISLWQVSDSAEQKACFKYCNEYKQKLTPKNRNGSI